MTKYDYDLYTIGAGSGGVRASRFAGGFGARVGIAEEKELGGTCVNVGCVPKKLFVYASQFATDFADSRGFGWTVGDTSFDWGTLISNKDKEISRLNGIYEWLLTSKNVDIHTGRAKLIDAHTVEVNGHKFTAENILIATGGRPNRPNYPGAEHVITSDEAFFIEELPESIMVVGGGYIGVEFAGIFHGLGVDVTILLRSDQILRGFDHDIRSHLSIEYEKKGIKIHTETQISSVEKLDDGQLKVTLDDGTSQIVGMVMKAIGRVPNTRGIGLENVGVELAPNGTVLVDDYLRTSVPNIYALGDIIDRYQLTPIATEQGMQLARNLFAGTNYIIDYDNVPTAIFSQPNAGTVGLTEAEARARYENVDIYRTSFKPMRNTISGNEERTLMKLVVDADSDRVLGVHMVGDAAGEIIQGFAVALKAGATKEVFDATVGIHPTSAEEFVTMREKVSG
ncbi:MAG: glutathione-disulfide reductase [Chloroflexota bacterium]